MTTAKRAILPLTHLPHGNTTFDAFTIDATTEKMAMVFVAQASDTITHLGFKYGIRTGTPPTYRISLQALDTSGNPDGTILGGGSPASATFTPPADTTWNNTWQWVALSNSFAITLGTLYAVVVDYSSGTCNAGNNSSFVYSTSAGGSFDRWGTGYGLTNTGSWAKAVPGPFGYKSAGSVYGLPIQAQTTSTVGTNGHRAACKFTLPTNFASTFQVAGFRIRTDSESAAGSNKYGIWNAAGTALQDLTLDSDAHVSPANTNRGAWIYFDEGTLATLNAGTAYYYGIERVGSSCGLVTWDFASSGDLTAMPWQGDAILSTWNGSAWSDDNTNIPYVELLLSDVTQSGGSGGVIGGPNKRGNMQ
jgi:hypothetical protein